MRKVIALILYFSLPNLNVDLSNAETFLERLPNGVSKKPSHIYYVGGQKDKPVYIFDAYSDHDLKFTPEELQIIFRLLESLAPSGVKLPQWIATAKIDDGIYGLGRGGAFATGDGGIVFPTYPSASSARERILTYVLGGRTVRVTSVTKWKGFAGYFLHELGHHIRWGLQDRSSQWETLHETGKLGQKRRALENNHAGGIPGSESGHEDLATTMGALINTEPFLHEVVRRAEKGYPLLLKKVLFAISLLVKEGPDGPYVDYYYYDNPFDHFRDPKPVLSITSGKIVLTEKSLILPGFEFSLDQRDGVTVIVSIKSLNKFKGSRIVNRDFHSNPIELPRFCLQR